MIMIRSMTSAAVSLENPDETPALDIDGTAIHSGRVEGQRNVPFTIYCDEPPGSTKRTYLFDHHPSRVVEIYPAIFN